jgi:hypothetical protein
MEHFLDKEERALQQQTNDTTWSRAQYARGGKWPCGCDVRYHEYGCCPHAAADRAEMQQAQVLAAAMDVAAGVKKADE